MLGYKMKRVIFISILMPTILFNYSDANESGNVVVFGYYDFGPQAMSYEVLGYEWWQWEAHGDSRPGKKYDIRVIVYRNISLDNVRKFTL